MRIGFLGLHARLTKVDEKKLKTEERAILGHELGLGQFGNLHLQRETRCEERDSDNVAFVWTTKHGRDQRQSDYFSGALLRRNQLLGVIRSTLNVVQIWHFMSVMHHGSQAMKISCSLVLKATDYRLSVFIKELIMEKSGQRDLPDIDKKKYLVPADLTAGQFVYVVRKKN
uniref:Uncharacterized protein n=1 Tax=Brassica oleracea TaxID=3712 RepID=A0A3P6BVP8_BRAOL|nr:unnamed protein product [Brassica oleracea]